MITEQKIHDSLEAVGRGYFAWMHSGCNEYDWFFLLSVSNFFSFDSVFFKLCDGDEMNFMLVGSQAKDLI